MATQAIRAFLRAPLFLLSLNDSTELHLLLQVLGRLLATNLHCVSRLQALQVLQQLFPSFTYVASDLYALATVAFILVVNVTNVLVEHVT